MKTPISLNETTLAQECLQRLGEEDGIAREVEEVLALVAYNSVGLGEVLQDFAQQTLSQLRDLTAAARNMANGILTPYDRETLANAYYILNTTRLVLERTPIAMQRNMAQTIGGDAKITREQMQRITHEFLHSPDIARLLNSEDSGRRLATFINPDGDVRSPDTVNLFMESARY